MADRRTGFFIAAALKKSLLFETISAKEAKNRLDCDGKHLGCSNMASRGLQYGLSGNSVFGSATSEFRF